MSLATFFATMRPFLLGEIDALDVERRLGPSASGTEALGFYRVLIERNVFKAMREIFPSLPPVIEQHERGRWRKLVTRYVSEHPPSERDSNAVGAGFSAWLQARRERDPSQPAVFEELADFHWCQVAAAHAVEPIDDGFDSTLFVRMYQHPVVEIVKRVVADPAAALPEPAPLLVVIFRHRVTRSVRLLYPKPEAWAVLAKREGLILPAPLAQLDPQVLARAEAGLVESGVLLARTGGVQ